MSSSHVGDDTKPTVSTGAPASTRLIELFGDTLVSSDGAVPTASALSNKTAVAIYFSAHWCPPCRGFTPKLAEWYQANLKAKGLEIIFVSSDKDQKEFEEYFKDMPWLALPYSDRDRKDTLSKKFKVRGIPTVVILDAEGNTMTTDGRAVISEDPSGEDIPWKPKSVNDILANAKLIGKDGAVTSDTLSGKVYGLYFSAHWCPPCRGFTPQLAEWYTTSLKNKGLEIVFVSSDKDQKQFDDYYKDMPWLALDYSERKAKEQLSKLFSVEGIPSLVIVDKDGSTITKDGRAALSADPEGSEFPWYPAPVHNANLGPGRLQDCACVVAFVEASDLACQKAAIDAMTPLAQKFLDEAKAKGDEDPEVSFVVVTEAGGIGSKLRSLMGLTTLPAEVPRLMILNIPDSGGYYHGPEGEITSDSVRAFVTGFQTGTLERKQLS